MQSQPTLDNAHLPPCLSQIPFLSIFMPLCCSHHSPTHFFTLSTDFLYNPLPSTLFGVLLPKRAGAPKET